MHDPILEEVWRARERLLKQYGGIDGLIKHVQAMDRARLRKAKAQRRKRPKTSSLTNSTGAGKPARKKLRRITSRSTAQATV